MMRGLKMFLSLLITFLLVLPAGGCSGERYSGYQYKRFQTSRKYIRHKKKYYRKNYTHHRRPVSKDYIIKNKRRDRGW